MTDHDDGCVARPHNPEEQRLAQVCSEFFATLMTFKSVAAVNVQILTMRRGRVMGLHTLVRARDAVAAQPRDFYHELEEGIKDARDNGTLEPLDAFPKNPHLNG
jgi:hypothetical protein